MHSSVDSRSTSSSVELTHEAALSSSSTEAPALAPVPRLALAWRGGVNPRLTERPRRPKSARRRMAARAWPQTRGRAPQALLGRASNARVQVGQERAEGGHTKSSLMGRWDAMLCAVQRCRVSPRAVSARPSSRAPSASMVARPRPPRPLATLAVGHRGNSAASGRPADPEDCVGEQPSPRQSRPNRRGNFRAARMRSSRTARRLRATHCALGSWGAVCSLGSQAPLSKDPQVARVGGSRSRLRCVGLGPWDTSTRVEHVSMANPGPLPGPGLLCWTRERESARPSSARICHHGPAIGQEAEAGAELRSRRLG